MAGIRPVGEKGEGAEGEEMEGEGGGRGRREREGGAGKDDRQSRNREREGRTKETGKGERQRRSVHSFYHCNASTHESLHLSSARGKVIKVWPSFDKQLGSATCTCMMVLPDHKAYTGSKFLFHDFAQGGGGANIVGGEGGGSGAASVK